MPEKARQFYIEDAKKHPEVSKAKSILDLENNGNKSEVMS